MDERQLLERYPLPIARSYRRFLDVQEHRERHDAALALYGVYLQYVSSMAIAWYLAGGARDHRVNATLKGLAHPTLEEWLRFLRECLEFLSRQTPTQPTVQTLVRLFSASDTQWPAVEALCHRMRSPREETPGSPAAVRLEDLLHEVVAYRDHVLAHGAPLPGVPCREFSDLLRDAFLELLDRSPFILDLRLLLFDSIRADETSGISCKVIEYMSCDPTPVSELLTLPYAKPLPETNRLYLLGNESAPVSLYPLLIADEKDVYLLNVVEGAPDYLSCATGDVHHPSDLEDTQGDLFTQILGYTVDGSHLERIYDDIARAVHGQDETGVSLGDYRILREIGHGGMGSVYEAIQESLGRRVALKVLPGTFAVNPKRVERFRREARATAALHHPNIVPVYEVGETNGIHYYTMEYIDGCSHAQLLRQLRLERKGSSSTNNPAYIANVVEQVSRLAEGLEEAHQHGLVHRDVKPSNILVNRDGRYVLIDFGLVREEQAQTLTRSGEVVGTLAYMSPEQASRLPLDARTDVYSLGVTLYELLTLQLPYRGDSDLAMQNAIVSDDPVPLRVLNSRIHRDIETIVLRTLEKQPERRYQSAAELAQDLRRFLSYEPIQARPLSRLEKARRWLWKHKGRLGAAAVLLLALTLTAVFWQRHQAAVAHATEQRTVAEIERLRPLISSTEDVFATEAIYSALFADNDIRPGAADAAARLKDSRVSETLRDGLIDWYLLARSAGYADWYLADLRTTIREVEEDGARSQIVAWILAEDPDESGLPSVDACLEAVERNELDAEDLTFLARTLPQDQRVRVPDILGRVIELEPGSFWAHFQLGQWYLQQSPPMLEEGQRHLLSARALRPDASWARTEYALALILDGYLDRGIDELEAAISIAPRDGQAHWLLSRALRLAGDPSGALVHTWKATDQGPEYTNISAAIQLLQTTELAGAIRVLDTLFLGGGRAQRPGRRTLDLTSHRLLERADRLARAHPGDPRLQLRRILAQYSGTSGDNPRLDWFVANHPDYAPGLLSQLWGHTFMGGGSPESRALVEKARQLAPDTPYPEFLSALVLANGEPRDLELAEARFRRAMTLEPAFDRGLLLLMNAYAKKRDIPGARRYLEEYTARHPDATRPYETLAKHCEDNKQIEEAVAWYGRYLEVAPGDLAARRHLADLLRQQKDFARARAMLEGLLKFKHYEGSAYLALGEICREEGDTAQALEHFTEAILRAGAYVTPETFAFVVEQRGDATGELAFRVHLAWAQRQQRDPKAALAELEMIPEAWRDHPDSLGAFGATYQAAEDWEAAIAVYRRLVAVQPGNLKPQRDLARCLRQAGQLDEALGANRLILSERPHDTEILFEIAAIQEQSGRSAEAIDTLTRAAAYPGAAARASIALGRLHLMLDQPGLALQSLLEAVQANPDGQEALALLEEILSTRIPPAQATAILHTLVLGTEHVRIFSLFGKVHEKLETVKEGIALLDTLLRTDPYRSEVRYRKGRMLESLGRYRDAAADFEECCLRFGPIDRFAENAAHCFTRAGDLRKAVEWTTRAARPGVSARRVIEKLQGPEPDLALNYCRELAAQRQRENALTPEILKVLADLEATAGNLAAAIHALERIPLLTMPPDATGLTLPDIESRLAGYRKAILPDLVSYPSIDDVLMTEKELIPEGAVWKFLRGTREPSTGLEWTLADFSDNDWEEGPTGIGYGDDDDATELTDMRNAYSTLYARNVFMVSDTAGWSRILLRLRIDDGCVVYLNGREVGRVRAGNRGARIPFDGEATAATSEPLATLEMPIDRNWLIAGRNCLAIQGLNHGRTSSDFSLIPVLLTEARLDRGEAREQLEAFKGVAGGEGATERLAYFQGRILQLEGRPEEASAVFAGIAARETSRVEPFLRLAECHAATGSRSAVLEAIRRAFGQGLGHARLWDLWWELAVTADALTPAQALQSARELVHEDETLLPEDLLYVLDHLTRNGCIRMNCGETGHFRDSGDRYWEGDRFALGGNASSFQNEIRGTHDELLYKSERWFPAEEPGPPGYRIPLPVGRYRVVLHVAENHFREEGQRLFGIALEGETVLEEFEPIQAGHATAQQLEYDLRVTDGYLDLTFIPLVNNPIVCGLEVLRR